ncbi:hypothetical protein AVEN_48853-1 [Araneus ventricosus]|uniref:Uncharacterized protein n=1 Tax=Araneus ventricosus TaxID=182803 RepID=A0A4Y2AGE6_ARAVE|nr:hypothetical protein AVEN_48853-1 [Araneus ventricosus]
MYACTFECLALSLPNANFKGNFYLLNLDGVTIQNRVYVNHKETTPVLPRHPESIGVMTAVGTKVGVLIDITGDCPAPPEGGTSRPRNGGNSTPHHYCTSQGK